MEYKVITTNDLCHYGIKGQKWGKRNGPPYPLDASDKSASEKRLSVNNKINKASKLNSSKTGFSDLDSNVQAAIVQIGTLTLAMASMALFKKIINKVNIKNCDKKLEDLYNNRDIKKLEDIPKLKKKMSTEENMKKVNPDFPKQGTTTNCMLCTTAMAMREKGYDVQASKNYDIIGYYETNINKLWSSEGSFKKIKATKSIDIINTLEKEPDGSYGNLCVYWKLGGGHSIFWKKERSKVVIYDSQSGKKIDNSELCDAITPYNSRYSRLNDAQPTDLLLGAIRKTKGE